MRLLEFLSLDNDEMMEYIRGVENDVYLARESGEKDYYERMVKALGITDLYGRYAYDNKSMVIKSRVGNINAVHINFEGVNHDYMQLIFGFTCGSSFAFTVQFDFHDGDLFRITYNRRNPPLGLHTEPKLIDCISGIDVLKLLREDGMIR